MTGPDCSVNRCTCDTLLSYFHIILAIIADTRSVYRTLVWILAGSGLGRNVFQVYRITRGDKIAHPLGRIPKPIISKTERVQTPSDVSVERSRRVRLNAASFSLDSYGEIRFGNPSQGGVLCYHPCGMLSSV